MRNITSFEITKPAIALELVAAALDANPSCPPFLAEALYGSDLRLRQDRVYDTGHPSLRQHVTIRIPTSH